MSTDYVTSKCCLQVQCVSVTVTPFPVRYTLSTFAALLQHDGPRISLPPLFFFFFTSGERKDLPCS